MWKSISVIILMNGLKVQWGKAGDSATVSFPLGYISAPKVFTNPQSNYNDPSCFFVANVTSVSTTKFTTRGIRQVAQYYVGDSTIFAWFAIGY